MSDYTTADRMFAVRVRYLNDVLPAALVLAAELHLGSLQLHRPLGLPLR